MKDKRTKEQILKLLDNAIEQEERLSEKIKSLETELANCRKKADDPRHELTEEAMPASKVSFRIDYYRTSEESPLKGIIEHLPSRQNKSFEGEGQLIINQFMSRFLTEETGKVKKKKNVVEEKIKPVPVPEVEAENKMKAMQEAILQKGEDFTPGTQLLQRLKAEFAAQNPGADSPPVKIPATKSVMASSTPPPESNMLGRLMARPLAVQTTGVKEPIGQPEVSNENPTNSQAPQRRSRLLERILEEIKLQ